MKHNLFKASLLGLAICTLEVNAADDQMQLSLLRMQNQVNELENKLAYANGQIEDLNHELEQLKQENEALKAKLASSAPAIVNEESKPQSGESTEPSQSDLTLTRVSGEGNATITPAKEKENAQASDKTSLSAVPSDAQNLYNDTYKLVEQGKFDAAVSGFKTYVEKYPDNALTPNAWYWMGQIQYRQKQYEESRVSFLHTAKFTASNKRMDALYKLGIISEELGDNEKAKRYYDLLVKSYPNTSSATLAQKKLEALN